MFPRMTFLCRSRLAWIHRSFCVRFRWKHSSRHPACYAWEYKTLATHSCSLLPAGSPGWPSAASGPMEAAVPLLHFSFPRFWVWCVINSMMKSSSLWCPSSKSCKRWRVPFYCRGFQLDVQGLGCPCDPSHPYHIKSLLPSFLPCRLQIPTLDTEAIMYIGCVTTFHSCLWSNPYISDWTLIKNLVLKIVPEVRTLRKFSELILCYLQLVCRLD